MSDEIRDHGRIVTAPAGTPEEAVINKLAGADDVPSLDQLSQAKKPEFDPHAGRGEEVDPGREFGDTAEPMIATIVVMGVDHGGNFEDRIQALVNDAEKMALYYVTASIAKLDLHSHFTALDEMDTGGLEDDEPLSEEQP